MKACKITFGKAPLRRPKNRTIRHKHRESQEALPAVRQMDPAKQKSGSTETIR